MSNELDDLLDWRNTVGYGQGCQCDNGDGEEWCVGTCIAKAQIATLTAERDGWRGAALAAAKLVDKYRAGADRYREALEDMTWQHAYRSENSKGEFLMTGGLSANEHAFDVLGWDDPQYVRALAGTGETQ